MPSSSLRTRRVLSSSREHSGRFHQPFLRDPGRGVKVSSLSYRLEASQEAIVRGHCLGTTIAFPSVKPETPTMQFTGRSPDGIADEE